VKVSDRFLRLAIPMSDDFFGKPADGEDLCCAVRTITEVHRGQTQVRAMHHWFIRPLQNKILRTLILRGCANILGTNAVTDCRYSHEEAAFSTTISFVEVPASSNSVSGISAFGTITSATVKRR